jgi:hypothetical protein
VENLAVGVVVCAVGFAARAVRDAAAVRVDPFLKSVGEVFKKIGVSKLGGMMYKQTDIYFTVTFF